MARESDDDTEHADVGAQLQAAADRQGLSDRQVALRAGLPHPTVAKAFRGGNVTLNTFRRLVQALGVTVVDFGPFKAAIESPDIAVTRAAFADLTDLERRIAATRASIGKMLEQRQRDHDAAEQIRESGRDATRSK